MRRYLISLLVGTACTTVLRKAAHPVALWSSCSLTAVTGIQVNFPHARQALQDFDQQVGHPYSLLYVDLHGGAPVGSNRCVRLVQQANQQFVSYDYQDSQVHHATVSDSTWEPLLARLGQGHFVGICTNYATESSEGIWLVKRDSVTVFSLAISLHEQAFFTGQDKVRVEVASKLTGRLLKRRE